MFTTGFHFNKSRYNFFDLVLLNLPVVVNPIKNFLLQITFFIWYRGLLVFRRKNTLTRFPPAWLIFPLPICPQHIKISFLFFSIFPLTYCKFCLSSSLCVFTSLHFCLFTAISSVPWRKPSTQYYSNIYWVNVVKPMCIVSHVMLNKTQVWCGLILTILPVNYMHFCKFFLALSNKLYSLLECLPI